MNKKLNNVSGTNEINAKKKKAPINPMLSILGVALAVAAYIVLLPIKVTPIVADITGVEDIVVMMDDRMTIEPVVLSDVELGKVDMPETKEVFGLSFNAKYDIQDFVYTVGFASSDETVITVNAEGVLFPVGIGKAQVTVSAADVSKTAAVTVKEFVRPESMPERVEILIGEKKDLVETGNEYQILKTEFSVIDSNVISIDQNGTITALAKGETTVGTILQNEESVLTTVKVLQPVTELSVNDKSVNVGATVKSGVKILPEGADYGVQLTYSSSDKSVATVNEKGVITGKSAGTATITVTSENGIEKQFTVTVKKVVVQAPVQQTPSSSGGGATSSGSSGTGISGATQTSGPTQLTDAEIAAIVSAGNAALGDRYFEGANSYGTDRNVITVNKSYDQVYNEVMALVSRTYVAGRVFNIGSTIIVAYSF